MDFIYTKKFQQRLPTHRPDPENSEILLNTARCRPKIGRSTTKKNRSPVSAQAVRRDAAGGAPRDTFRGAPTLRRGAPLGPPRGRERAPPQVRFSRLDPPDRVSRSRDGISGSYTLSSQVSNLPGGLCTVNHFRVLPTGSTPSRRPDTTQAADASWRRIAPSTTLRCNQLRS